MAKKTIEVEIDTDLEAAVKALFERFVEDAELITRDEARDLSQEVVDEELDNREFVTTDSLSDEVSDQIRDNSDIITQDNLRDEVESILEDARVTL